MRTQLASTVTFRNKQSTLFKKFGRCSGQVVHVADSVVKGEAITLQAWTGPEGSRGLRLPNFKTIST